MRRDQLEHAIRAACQIAGLTEVIIVGSQAILGTYTEDELPFSATRSVEVDVLPIADDTGEIDRLADEIEGAAGRRSPGSACYTSQFTLRIWACSLIYRSEYSCDRPCNQRSVPGLAYRWCVKPRPVKPPVPQS